MSYSLNIISFGEIGVGKSSVINLIAGRELARASLSFRGCTMSFVPYSFNVSGRNFHIWDTVDLQDPELDANDYLATIEQACDLIQQLHSRGGVDLLLFCIRGDIAGRRDAMMMQRNYRLFYEVLCQSQVPIALVVTHLEQEVRLENWWERNQEKLFKYGFQSAGHACVTTLPKHRKYEESRENIRRLLQGTNGNGKFVMPPERWSIGFSRRLNKDWKRKDLVKFLMERCGIDREIADGITDKMIESNQSLV